MQNLLENLKEASYVLAVVAYACYPSTVRG